MTPTRIALVCAAVLALAGCGGEEQRAAAPGASTGDSAAREAAPPVAGTTLDGERLSLAELRGRPVMVNAWASW